MDVVVINRSRRKAGLMLALLGLTLLTPLLVYIQSPVEINQKFNRSSYSQIAFSVFALGLLIITTVYFSLVIFRMLRSKTVALELNEKGIRYNLTGRAEQYLPAEDIYGAALEKTANGSFSALLVLRKEGRAEYLASPAGAKILKTAPAMRIFHEFLDGSPDTIAHTINQYFGLSKTAEKPEIYERNKTGNAYIPLAVGSALIAVGFLIPFSSVPLWIGLAVALLTIALGSIVLFVSPDKVTASDLPKEVSKITKRGIGTLFSGFTAPIPTLLNRFAGAVLYPTVGVPACYSILSYVLCNKFSCEKAYDVSAEIVLPMILTLFIVGYGMGVGRRK